MAKKKKNGRAKKNNAEGEFIFVDPARVRFQHSRIRPFFSGCGRSVTATLDSIRLREILTDDLPPIQVLIGPIGEDGQPWYFSLNNRRLWVLKRCREEGLLENNKIRVRVRPPKSSGEESRYTIENCALEAKLMRESSAPQKSDDQEQNVSEEIISKQDTAELDRDYQKISSITQDDESSSDESVQERSNPFSVLL